MIKSLLTFNESTTKDDRDNSWSVIGSPTLSKDIKKFGNSSLDCRNGGIKCDNINSIGLKSNFTIECYFYWLGSYITNEGEGSPIFETSSSDSGISVDNGKLTYGHSSDTLLDSAPVNVFTHVAMTVDINNSYTNIFVNGKKVFERNIIPPIDRLYIGYCARFNSNNRFNGYIDELIITDSIKYTSNFTPPTVPTILQKILLLGKDNSAYAIN